MSSEKQHQSHPRDELEDDDASEEQNTSAAAAVAQSTEQDHQQEPQQQHAGKEEEDDVSELKRKSRHDPHSHSHHWGLMDSASKKIAKTTSSTCNILFGKNRPLLKSEKEHLVEEGNDEGVSSHGSNSTSDDAISSVVVVHGASSDIFFTAAKAGAENDNENDDESTTTTSSQHNGENSMMADHTTLFGKNRLLKSEEEHPEEENKEAVSLHDRSSHHAVSSVSVVGGASHDVFFTASDDDEVDIANNAKRENLTGDDAVDESIIASQKSQYYGVGSEAGCNYDDDKNEQEKKGRPKQDTIALSKKDEPSDDEADADNPAMPGGASSNKDVANYQSNYSGTTNHSHHHTNNSMGINNNEQDDERPSEEAATTAQKACTMDINPEAVIDLTEENNDNDDSHFHFSRDKRRSKRITRSKMIDLTSSLYDDDDDDESSLEEDEKDEGNTNVNVNANNGVLELLSSDEEEDNANDLELLSACKGACSVCKTGGDLICCSFCKRGCHFRCHAPPISSVPSSQWKCRECSTTDGLNLMLPKPRRSNLQNVHRRHSLRKRPAISKSKSLDNTDDFDFDDVDEESSEAGSPSSTRRKKKQNELFFRGKHSDECHICSDGGSLICCAYCDKAFHASCHIPPLSRIPPGLWKCCECRAPELTKRYKCGECAACLKKDCRRCRFCRDMTKFGGAGVLKQVCIEKRCPNKRYALPTAAQQAISVVTPEPTSRRMTKTATTREIEMQGSNDADSSGSELDCTSIVKSTTQKQVERDNDDESYLEVSSSSSDDGSIENDDDCYICSYGGDLICCDFCEKSFHGQCHIPRLDKVPRGKWKCCECSADAVELSNCGECDDCLQPNCGECGPCLDREIFGTSIVNEDVCELKKCKYMRYADPEKENPNQNQNGTFHRRSSIRLKKTKQKKKYTKNPKKSNRKQARRRANNRHQPRCNDNIVQSPFTSYLPSDEHCVGGLRVQSVNLGQKKKKLNFFAQIFMGRTCEVKVKVNENPPERSFLLDGRRLELVSGKLPREKCGMYDVKEMKLVYVATEVANMPRIDLPGQLNRLCSFGALGPVKACARLAHLQAEAKHVCFTKFSNIEFINECGNEGCGFFPRGFFDGSGPRKYYDSVQIRLIGPKLGLAKGMLFVKEGINTIQIAKKSMIKAPPSESCSEEWVAVIMKNVFPCKNNIDLGKLLDPDDDACSTYKKSNQRELSPMHQRMLIGYGISKKDVDQYTKRSTNPRNRKHAHLKGVADPTLKIPKDKVFISGFTANSNNERVLFGKRFGQVYVSRSPAVCATDAKILSVLGEKADGMSHDEWNLLCSYKFGTVIFGTPRNSSTPVPCIIADGDLDGDDYFVLWEEEILSYLLHSNGRLTSKSRQLLLELKMPDPDETALAVHKTTTCSHGKENWLSLAQDKMLDFSTQNAESQITGKLYNLCFKASQKEGGKVDIYDEDALAYGRAYKDAIDIQKHGGKVFLPEHLHDTVEPRLRTLLL